ncbi:hypothetical protein EJ110_NYTH32145 [Nymphaea thermarum]|nr:hypothetical protein EJ110_NYTH32145 [Nymphaea thermarum]
MRFLLFHDGRTFLSALLENQLLPPLTLRSLGFFLRLFRCCHVQKQRKIWCRLGKCRWERKYGKHSSRTEIGMINDKIIGNIRKLFVTNKAKIDSLGGQSNPFEFHSQPFGSSECAFVSSQSTLAISPVQFGYSFLLDQSSLRRQNLDGKLRGYSTSRQIESAKVGDTVAEGTADTHVTNKEEKAEENETSKRYDEMNPHLELRRFGEKQIEEYEEAKSKGILGEDILGAKKNVSQIKRNFLDTKESRINSSHPKTVK